MAKKEKKNVKKDGELNRFVGNIIDNYSELENSIVRQLSIYNANHSVTTGSLREDIWMELFERIIPKKFVVEHSVFIIDSYNQISKEVDLAIIDNTYTPYIFQYGRLKYVPIEAVAAAVECKSTRINFSEKDAQGGEKDAGLALWCDSILQLRTSLQSIVRMASGTVIEGVSYNQKGRGPFSSTQTSTRPIMIFCGYKTSIRDKDLKEIKKRFDFILIASEDGGQGTIEITTNEAISLQRWYEELNHYKRNERKKSDDGKEEIAITKIEELEKYSLEKLVVKKDEKEISLLTFNLQLNQLLMLINNPILFPHLGYAEMFNGKERKWDA